MFKLKYVIKHAFYSTLKSKSTALYRCHLGFLAFSFIHQHCPYRVNNVIHLMVEPEVLLPEAGFFTFSIELMFTHILVWVDILSNIPGDQCTGVQLKIYIHIITLTPMEAHCS